LLRDNIDACYNEDRKKVRELHEQVKLLMIDTKNRKNSFTLCLKDVDEDSLEYGHFYLQMLHYIREFSHSINYIVDASYEHIFNNHRGFNNEQYKELEYLCEHLEDIFRDVKKTVLKQDFDNKSKIKSKQEKLLDRISDFQSNQVKRIKHGNVNTRNSLLYMTTLFGIRDLLVHVNRLLKVQSKFSPSIPIDKPQKKDAGPSQIQLELE
jgi:Na+/phosphate symporter